MTTLTAETLAAAYEAAHKQAILVDRGDLGLLKFSGATRLDLLHRMSTQAVKGLGDGEGAATILTSDIGRMIDRLIRCVGRFGRSAVVMATVPGDAIATTL